jgi:hypothetical protein
MRDGDAAERRRSSVTDPRAIESSPDERDATIERLERILEEERQAASELRASNEALRFQLQVLEKSYAKQLEDARLQREDAERQLAAQQSQFAALDAECRETMRLLAQTRTYLKEVAEERARMRWLHAPRDGRGLGPASDGFAPPAEGTINELIADDHWRRAPAQDVAEGSHAGTDPAPESSGELIAPELVFTDDDEDDGKV